MPLPIGEMEGCIPVLRFAYIGVCGLYIGVCVGSIYRSVWALFISLT